MTHDSSPLPIRHIHTVPKTPSAARSPIVVEDADELAGDTIPCSPTAFLQRDTFQREVFRENTTQPSLGLGHPSLGGQRSSSPASVVEVPASSPFQPPKKETSKFASRLAPAGTMFRPPPRQPPSSTPKRPPPEPISLLSDDDDDDDELTPPRGDIKPTTFKAQMAAFAYNPAAEERETREKLRQVYDVFGDKYPSNKVREALKRCHNDLDDTINLLEEEHACQSPALEELPKKPAGRRLISKGAIQSTLKSFKRTSSSREESPEELTTPPKPTKRRLVQGLRNKSFSSPQKVDSSPPPSSEDPLVIDLVDNDNEDAYRAEASPSPASDEDDRVLTCVNTSTLQELAAMTGMKEADLEPLVAKRPFDSLDQARRVTADKKPNARRSTRATIGETAVDEIEVFLDAVSAIDEVVAKCEVKAQTVRGVLETWDLDTFGHNKRSKQTSPEADMPLTPTSLSGSRLKPPLVPKQPDLMDGHCEMKPFQLFGLNWMSLLYNYDIGCILADEMGLGKTCQVISFISHLVEEYEKTRKGERPWPNLVVVPPSTYKNWLTEFERFAPGLSVVGYRGSQSERAEIAYEVEQNPDEYHVVLATYSQINSEADIEAMQSFGLNVAVFDEGHKMKNPSTKIYRDLRRITSSWKMLLTGTPVQNNLLEMTSLLSFINPKLFEGYVEPIKYIFSHKVTIRDVTNGAFLYGERVRRARTILEPFILQRRKDQVLSDMPPKTNTVVHCPMSAAQKSVYDEYEELFRRGPSQRSGQARGRQNDQNNVWMQLRKAALHPLLFRRHFKDDNVEEMGKILMDRLSQDELQQPDIKHLIQELKNSSDFELHLWCRDYPRLLASYDILPSAQLDSGKVTKLLELVAQYQKNGDRVLVFSKFSRVVELLREVLALEDINHRVLMGNTNVSERQELIDEFNEDESIPVFLLTTGAGGTGINLTSANKVIIFDQSDNPQDDIQAENRAHRLGQTREVEVIRLISSQTMEELIYKACQKKIELANKVTGAIEEDDTEVGKKLEKEVRQMMEEQMTPP